MGASASVLQLFVSGVYAEPSSDTSPQQPPPQPISSWPVQTAIPCRVGGSGKRRHSFFAGSNASRSQPQTSISVPVQTASRRQKLGVAGGVASACHVFDAGS